MGKRLAEPYRLHSLMEFLNDCSLMDIGSRGCAFTWVNNRDGEDVVKERLDRVLCTMEWRLTYPETEVFALPALGSDHSPILLPTEVTPAKRRKAFTFKAFWLQDKDCRTVIADSWASLPLKDSTLSRKLQVASLALAR